MTDSKTLVSRLRRVAAELRTAAVWNGTGLAVDATKDDYLYELCCYFRLALVAAPSFRLRIAGAIGTAKGGKPAAKWPKKPGQKQNFSYLSLADKSGRVEQFQLCPGIKVTDVHGKDRAPDLILLNGGAPAQPTHVHVLAFWDAKYTSALHLRLPDTAVSDFIFTYQQLGTPILSAAWSQKVRGAEWQRSGLLTNGQASTEPTATLIAYNVSETHGFPDGPPVTRP
jgi:hypothetical protein